MRNSVLAAIAVVAFSPCAAAASGHTPHDRRMTIPQVRIHAPQAGTTWRAPVGTREDYTREDYRRDDYREPLYADEGYTGPQGPMHDDYDYDRFDDGHAYGVEDYAMSDRFLRDDRGGLDYDRDYPYDAPYGNHGGFYTIIETTVTTGPSVVTYAEDKKVAVHRATRMVKKRRAYRAPGRVMGSKIRRLR